MFDDGDDFFLVRLGLVSTEIGPFTLVWQAKRQFSGHFLSLRSSAAVRGREVFLTFNNFHHTGTALAIASTVHEFP
jgi:hypothetical protein